MTSKIKKTIMIVEDIKMHMGLMDDLLRPAGYATVGTNKGRRAVNLARKHHPDLILMDIQLGDISGLEVTKKLKEDKDLKDIPIIAVTAFAQKGDREMMLAAGCDDYIPKPIRVANFLETVKKNLA